jgi:hypothetical protein
MIPDSLYLLGTFKLEISFDDHRLAAECNSAVAMAARWGEQWESVSVRLVQLAACARVADIAELPGVKVNCSGGHHVVTFPDGVSITAVEHPPAGSATAVTSAAVIAVMWDRP